MSLYNSYFSCITGQEFVAYSDTAFTYQPVSYIGSDDNLTDDSWGWNESLGAHVRTTTTTKKGSFTIPIGYLKKGDVVRASGEFMKISGDNPRITILNSDISKVRDYYSNGLDAFETLDIEMVALDDGNHKIIFGTTTSEIGEFYVRNIKINLKTSISNNRPYEKTFKTFPIKTTGVGVFALNSQFVKEGCTFSFNAGDLRITFDEPFKGYASFNRRVITFISQRATTNTQRYDIRNCAEEWYANGTFVTLRFYEQGTNTIVDPSTIPANVVFDLLVIGMDTN